MQLINSHLLIIWENPLTVCLCECPIGATCLVLRGVRGYKGREICVAVLERNHGTMIHSNSIKSAFRLRAIIIAIKATYCMYGQHAE